MAIHRPSPLALLATGLLIALAPALARAGNTVHPRTPVLWPDVPCIQTIDSALSPSFAFEYEIPAEDTALSIDEFEDSRTHQFIAFCRQWPAGRPPPAYVSVYDLERSIEAGHEPAEAIDDPESTLETSAQWAGCWVRVTADDARRPITLAAAAAPVEWDLSAVELGTWMLAGYTWEPPYNLWSRAPWVLRVIDEAAQVDPAPAAVSIANTPDTAYPDEVLELPVCVAASPGSTLTLEWAPNKPELLEWTAVDGLELDGPGGLTLPFAPPPASLGLTIVLRAAVTQPAGAGYDGHALDSLIVFANPPGDGDGDTTGGDETSGDGSEESGDTAAVDSGADGSSGGHCSIGPPRGTLPWLAFALGLPWLALLSRRRRRAPC